MKLLKKVGIFIWTLLPLIYLASFKDIEVEALERAYAVKECDTNYLQIREKDYQKRFDEGYEKGFENGAIATYHRAKAATFDALMGALEEMGVFDEEKGVKEEVAKTALHRTIHQSSNKNEVHY